MEAQLEEARGQLAKARQLIAAQERTMRDEVLELQRRNLELHAALEVCAAVSGNFPTYPYPLPTAHIRV
jgi:hypothetical protein